MPLNYATSVITAWKTSNADANKAAVDALLDEVVATVLLNELAQEAVTV